MELELEDRVVLVTGGSNGLGRALCHRLVAERARVMFCGLDRDRVTSTEQALREEGGDAAGLVADVTKPEQLASLVETAVERWGRIDGLVNNAGRAAAKSLLEITDEEWAADLDLKLHAAVRLSRLTVDYLSVAGGSIVNVLAIAAKAPGARSMPSSISRAAGMAMTKALSKELGPLGIRVNAVLIGLVRSGQWERASTAAGQSSDDFYDQLAGNTPIPLQRVGRAEEFADLAAYLLSSRASYVTGTAVNLDGGMSAVV
jgi:NAD(P)-dependent dehydrogenase (short-subunit alcohol dehydrogenase family)